MKLLVGAAVSALVTAAPGTAAASIAVSGTIVPTGGPPPSVKAADGNTVVDATGTHAWFGSLTGTSAVTTHFVIHSDGTLTYQGQVTFTGVTPCGVGTVTLEAQGSGLFPGPAYGRSTTIDQARSTVAMHANLDTVLFLTPSGAVITYSGEVRCG